MCSILLLTITSGHWFYLRWLAWLILLSAGLRISWSAICYGVRLRNLHTKSTDTPWPIPNRLYVPWRYLVTWGKMIRASKWVRAHTISIAVCFGFILGNPVGYLVRDIQTAKRLHTQTIHVLEDLGSHQYTVECHDPQGCRLEICPGPDPGFDKGDWIEVTWEEMDNGRGGRCMSFVDQERTKWHAKNREASWTTQTQQAQ